MSIHNPYTLISEVGHTYMRYGWILRDLGGRIIPFVPLYGSSSRSLAHVYVRFMDSQFTTTICIYFFFRRKYAPDDALSDKFFENARVSRCIRLYKVLCYFCFVSFLRVAVFDFFLGIHGECWLYRRKVLSDNIFCSVV